MSLRSEYLENHWEKYPVSTSPIHGRLLRLNDEICIIQSEDKIREYTINSKINLAPQHSAQECLRAGDIIEIHLSGADVKAIKLLVPARRETPFLKTEFNLERAQIWNKYINVIRNFFETRGFTELRTPTLVPSPGLEPFLDPFETVFNIAKTQDEFFLPTSPEFHLKKALTLGFERIFEFKECFRNGELSQTHQPEFLMLEWYRAYEKTESLIDDVQELFENLQKVFLSSQNPKPVQVFKMEDLWLEVFKFNLTPQTNLTELQGLAKSLKIFEKEKDFDDLFNLLFLEKIEPFLKEKESPVIVWHYPPRQAALARLTKEGWADRFEVYWRGFEIANAFHELNDSREQELRFKKDQEKKKKLGKKIVPLDQEFMNALEWGMPPSAGIALGVERLFMGLFKLKEIGECRLFSLKF